MTSYNCPICYENIPEEKMVVCENGHLCCKRHHLERVRAAYQEGHFAFHGGIGMRCFECRSRIDDVSFGDFNSVFFKTLRIIQSQELHAKFCREQGIDPKSAKMVKILEEIREMMLSFKSQEEMEAHWARAVRAGAESHWEGE
jgi:hypothetical protein